MRSTRRLAVAELTTYRLGGPVAVVVRIRRDGDLDAVAGVVARHRPPVLVIGRGSNLLVADSGFAGVGIVLESEFERVTLPAEAGTGVAATVHAGAAVPLPVLARRTAAAGFTGLEFFVGIPGSVGGAVRMNAGGHGRGHARRARVRPHADLLAGPGARDRTWCPRARPRVPALERRCRRGGDRSRVRGHPRRPDRVRRAHRRVVRWRREHQPGGANAGSVFRNPPGDSAGRLIDSCGLKGLRVGGALVSEKHANFFQAEPGATATDVHRLVVEVGNRVEAATGVRLVPELQMVGFEEGD